LRWPIAFIIALLAAGCEKEDMASQPKEKPMQQSVFFADQSSARPAVIGAIARGDLDADSLLNRGYQRGLPATTFPDHYPTEADGPFPMQGPRLRLVLRRGREQFTIYCAMCHGDAGDGHGIIVQRGFPLPPSYHLDRLRTAPVGHFFDVITNGYGAMYGYGDRIAPADRWTIVAYIRTLQLSQGAAAEELSPTQRDSLSAGAK
jgi:mono/diheme cytochrome c family protein